MLWLKGQLIYLKTMSKKRPVTELLEFEPLSVWSPASLPYTLTIDFLRFFICWGGAAYFSQNGKNSPQKKSQLQSCKE